MPGLAQGGAHIVQFRRVRNKHPFIVGITLLHIVRAAFQRQVHRGILRKAFRHDAGFSLAFKLVGHGTGSADAAPVLGKQSAQLGSGTVRVVRRHFNQESRARRAVAFISNLLDGGAAQFPGAFLDGAFNILLGGGHGLGPVNGGPQARVQIRISAAALGGQHDFMGKAGKHLALLGIFLSLNVLDLRPFIMS